VHTKRATHTPVDYGYLRRVVLKHSHNVLHSSRDYLFDSRLSVLVRNSGMNTLHELVEHLRQSGDARLEAAVAHAMTINETSFFRDSRPFELLRTELLPQLVNARRSTRSLRFWSAACSTGQEAYSLAMLVRAEFPLLSQWSVRVDGTDIREDLVRYAAQGRYARMEVNRGLPARHMLRFFEQSGDDWVARPEIRALCSFRQANLGNPPLAYEQSFDVILLRNVMLYFGQETRRALLAEVHRLLAPDGVLLLGSSEQPADMSLWRSAIAGGTCYFRPKASRQ